MGDCAWTRLSKSVHSGPRKPLYCISPTLCSLQLFQSLRFRAHGPRSASQADTCCECVKGAAPGGSLQQAMVSDSPTPWAQPLRTGAVVLGWGCTPPLSQRCVGKLPRQRGAPGREAVSQCRPEPGAVGRCPSWGLRGSSQGELPHQVVSTLCLHLHVSYLLI